MTRTQAKQLEVIVYTPEPFDGAARYAAEVVKALHTEGIQASLFCPDNFAYSEELWGCGVPMSFAPVRDVSRASLFMRIWRNLKFAVRSSLALHSTMSGGECVHFQNPLHFPLGLLPYLVVRLNRGHIILTAHDPIPHRWRLPRYLRAYEMSMLQQSYRHADAIVVHNLAGKTALQDTFKVPSNRIHVIPHGPVSSREARSTYPSFEKLKLLCFGAIRENKGIHLAIEAVQQLNAQTPIPIELNIRGELYTAAEGAYWNSCLRLIERAPLGIDVEEGFVPDEEVGQLFASHHAVLLPYLDFFSESGVAAMAISHGRPIIATNSGGLGEMMTQLECGIPISSPVVADVVDAINLVLSCGRDKLEEMGRTGRSHLYLRRSWRMIAERTVEVYSSCQPSRLRRQKSSAISAAS